MFKELKNGIEILVGQVAFKEVRNDVSGKIENWL